MRKKILEGLKLENFVQKVTFGTDFQMFWELQKCDSGTHFWTECSSLRASEKLFCIGYQHYMYLKVCPGVAK